MRLQTLHGDSSRPELLLGLFECPGCGHEARRPLEFGASEVKLVSIEIPDAKVATLRDA